MPLDVFPLAFFSAACARPAHIARAAVCAFLSVRSVRSHTQVMVLSKVGAGHPPAIPLPGVSPGQSRGSRTT